MPMNLHFDGIAIDLRPETKCAECHCQVVIIIYWCIMSALSKCMWECVGVWYALKCAE